MDVVSLDYHGVHEAVASLGTSLTEKQAALIKRYAPKVYICYDGDGAGIRAARRAIAILEAVDITPKLVVLPDGKDPDDVARQEGAEAFYGYLDQAMDPLDFELRLLKAGYDLETPAGRLDFLPSAIDFLAAIPQATKRAVMAQEVAQLAGVTPESIESDLAQKRAAREAAQAKAPAASPSYASPTFAPPEESFEEDETEPFDGDPWEPFDIEFPETGIQVERKLAVERYRLERELVRFLWADAAWEESLGELADSFIADPGLQEALLTIRRLRQAGLPPQEELLGSVHLSPEARESLSAVQSEGEAPEGEMVQSLEFRVRNFMLRERRQQIEREIRESATSEASRREALFQELMDVERRLRAGRGGL